MLVRAMTLLVFKIFIAGLTTRNKDLIASFREACANKLGEGYQIQVVDILKSPIVADEKKILATPTIIREAPFPERRIIGDFRESSQSQQALRFLTEDVFK
jgi:circadian clock protein KaiB